ncbi:hypothetical protein H0N95_02630 [Candidatus Micrarchaeota archaeon]|nr:hypothetical protein [Candidatus Micrarchaeota archaeon]
MSSRVLLLMLICLLIAFYLKMSWLMTLICGALVILGIASIEPKKTAKKPAPKGEQEIIYPVIYEDTGDAPYLFPEKFEVKAYPGAKGGTWPMWSSASKAVGSMFAVGMKMLLHGGKKKKEKNMKEGLKD